MLDACGVRVAVLPPDEVTRTRWLSQWSRALADGDPAAVDATVDARAALVHADLDSADSTLASRVTVAALEHWEGVRMSLHAAGLADRDGRALALVAASGTGKTTAARVVGARLGYLSDETVSLGPELDLLPHAKPLSVVVDPVRPHHKAQHSPDQLGLLVPPASATLRSLVFLDRGTDHDRTGLTLLSVHEGVELLLPQTSYATSFDAPLLELARILQASGPWLLRYAEIDDHVDDLVALLHREPPTAVPLRHHPGRTAPTVGPTGSYARAPWHDAVEADEEVSVLVGGTSYRLQQLGATVWLALEQAADLDALVESAVRRHGEHPDSRRIVQDAVDVLVGSGLVVRL